LSLFAVFFVVGVFAAFEHSRRAKDLKIWTVAFEFGLRAAVEFSQPAPQIQFKPKPCATSLAWSSSIFGGALGVVVCGGVSKHCSLELLFSSRDLKPDNLLLDQDGHVVFIDFGVSSQLKEAKSFKTQGKAGTDLYMGKLPGLMC
jgi:serine/threonine protein kinase